MRSINILLVDDHSLFRKGIASLLADEPGFQVVGEATDGKEAVVKARELKPDVILLDIHMPRMDGLEALAILKQETSTVNIVMLTVSDDDDSLFEAIKLGASGYLLKNMQPVQLFEMLSQTRAGHVAISSRVATRLFDEVRAQTESDSDEPDALTDRELDVLAEIVKGATNKEIGENLFVTENTVKVHLRNILDKLQVRNRIQAAVMAVRDGLIDDADIEPDDEDNPAKAQ